MKKYFFAVFLIFILSFSTLATVDFPMFVSEFFLLEKDYTPSETIDVSDYIKATRSPLYMEKQAGECFIEMMKAMKADGIENAFAQSGLRSYSYQNTLFQNELKKQKGAYNTAKTIVALPGASEHQTGLAMDISIDGSLTESFARTKAGIWLAENSYKYGFVLRFPSDKTAITGIIFEPWHFRFVGRIHAAVMKSEALCLEEYYNKYFELSQKPLSEFVFTQLSKGNISSETALNIDESISIEEFLKLFGLYDKKSIRFDASRNISRKEGAIIIGKLMNIDISKEEAGIFTDVGECDKDSVLFLSAMQKRGIFCLFENGNIKPEGDISVGAACDIACYLKR